jgi:hypothetical protein
MSRPRSAPITAVRDRLNRSAVSNGTKLPGGVHPQSSEARRFRDVLADLTAELGADPTAGEELQIRAIATLTLQLERMQADVLRGQATDAEQLTRCSNALARSLAALRRSRAARPATTGQEALAQHLARKRAENRE